MKHNDSITENIYQSLLVNEKLLTNLLKEQENANSEIEHTLFAVRVAKDILENRVISGKTVTILYPQGQLILR